MRLTSHPYCPKPSAHPRYPTRLLRLSTRKAILIDTKVELPNSPYATLSHCLGEPSFTTLTEDTIDHFRFGILITEFLRTFRDAMLTVQRLGISYIWIDCFCIIQNGSEWELEAASMSEVYANSVLNIGAGHAANPIAGCFTSRAPFPVQRRQILWRPVEPAAGRIFDMIFSHIDYSEATSDRKDEPLYYRAWVIQERTLWPRMLHIMRSGMLWECQGGGWLSEGSPARPLAEQTNLVSLVAGLMSREYWASLPAKEKAQIGCQIWETTLVEYSKASLRDPNDKMMAILAVAKILADYMNDIYADGFFEKFLPKTLCWLPWVRPGIQPVVQPQKRPWRAPSWSWLSWDGPIEFGDENFTYGGCSFVNRLGHVFATCIRHVQGKECASPILCCIGKVLPLRRVNDRAFIDIC